MKIHIENMKKYRVPVVVAINRFDTDTEEELRFLQDFVEGMDVPVAVNEAFAKGSEGAVELAEKVVRVADDSRYEPLLKGSEPVREKIEILAREIYRAKNVVFTKEAEASLERLEKNGYGNLPLIVAKTQYSISDDPDKLGAPKDYTFTVRDFLLSAGAGFVVAVAGDIMLMPGLGKKPNAVNIDIDENGNIVGLF